MNFPDGLLEADAAASNRTPPARIGNQTAKKPLTSAPKTTTTPANP